MVSSGLFTDGSDRLIPETRIGNKARDTRTVRQFMQKANNSKIKGGNEKCGRKKCKLI